jgi:hypothetical protein
VLVDLATRQRGAGEKPGEPQLRLQAANLAKLNDTAGYARTLEEIAETLGESFYRGALAQMPGLGAENDYVFGHLLGLDSSSRQALVEVGVIR